MENRWREDGFWPDVLVGDYIAAQAARHAETLTVFYDLIGEPELVSNRERFEDAQLAVNALDAAGLCKGDVVAIQLTASRITASLYHACLSKGLVVLPIVTIYGEDEVAFILEQAQARIFFSHDRLRSADYLSNLKRYRRIETLEHVVVVGQSAPAHATLWHEFIAGERQQHKKGAAGAEIVPDDACLIVYTSGTTSKPKGVIHSHNTLLAEWTRPSFQIGGPHLCCFPMGHYTGFSFLMRPLVCGTASIFMDRWDAATAARLIAQYSVTDCGGTPYFLLTLLKSAQEHGINIRSLKNFPMGGTGITSEHIRMADQAGFTAGRVYGSTEHPTVTYTWNEMTFSDRATTDGKIEEGNEVRVVNRDLQDLDTGAEGEIVTRGPELFRGYVDSTLNTTAFLEGRWFRTGDLGRLDCNGCLTITGRIKDIIIRGGENISALEIEEYINGVNGVQEVAVVGLPDELLGEKVAAFVIANPNTKLSAQGVINALASKGIARQKIPVQITFVDDFPRTPSGKVKKDELRNVANDIRNTEIAKT
jgi:acyl-coenzyme A synthetase/AMP-(fatty) acid ligase